ncbi:MAG: glutathione S-transferase family protein [Alphaproteobacteria bacterium]|jgi:glutathione S-transferase|nr:glutathione S-transferase family protein [Alphaproteobacteria bacterium]MDP6829928.1 glutathione S-transferase family protein [Alphaproteobacteria bacterium]MDP6874945.1 glutathione S-transferase family protein [Alphaproteobacteria bacterium]
MTITLHGYTYSVYSRIPRMVCHEKGIAFDWREVDPFDDATPESYGELHPFRRVPVLQHDGFTLYETGAISRYLDEAFPGPSLQPADIGQRARMAQIISIVDAYVYWPLVRQVFSHRVFRPKFGDSWDEDTIAAGLETSKVVLAALESLVSEHHHIISPEVSLADFHLATMIDYFAMADEGATMLAQYEKSSAWWANMRLRDSVTATAPL